MKTLILACVLVLSAFQTPPEAYPGQRQHADPPPSWFCSASPKKGDEAHKCSCTRMAQATPVDPDCCEAVITEDPKCTVYCHMDHCMCKVTCKKGEHSH